MRIALLALVACGSSNPDPPPEPRPGITLKEAIVENRARIAAEITKDLSTGWSVRAEGPDKTILGIHGGCDRWILKQLVPSNRRAAELEKAGFRSINCGRVQISAPGWEIPSGEIENVDFQYINDDKKESWSEFEERKRKWNADGHSGDPPPLP